MSGVRRWLARLTEWLRSGAVGQDADSEIQAHIDLAADDYVRRGLDPAAARAAARRDFGGVDRAREAVRDARGFRPLDHLGRDVRYAIRLLAKTPGFTAAAVLTLALGIGVNTAIFSLVDGVMLRLPPYPNADRLVALWESSPGKGPEAARTRTSVAPANLADYVARSSSFDAVTMFANTLMSLTGAGTPERLLTVQVSRTYLDVLGVPPALGRGFADSDFVAGQDNVVIVTHAFWQRRLGGDTAATERTIDLDGRPTHVIGVMPPAFVALGEAEAADPPSLIVPLVLPADMLTGRGEHIASAAARLKRGVSVEAARAELTAVSEGLAREIPQIGEMRAEIAPLGADQARDVRTLVLTLWAAVGLVLLVACVNVAALFLVRSISRQREVAVRFALGATRGRVAGELIVQSLVLAGLGGGAGLALAFWVMRTLVRLAPATIPHLDRVTLDTRVLFFTIALSAITGVVFGLLPAWQVRRAQPVDTLRANDRAVVGGWAARSRSVLVVVEIALSMMLLVGAALMVRSLIALNRVDLGFEPEGVLAANIGLPPATKPPARLAFFEALADRVSAMPGVRGVAFGNRLPLRGNWGSGFLIEPAGGDDGVKGLLAGFQAVSPGYFATFGMSLKHGRALAVTDRTSTEGVAVVNEQFARSFLNGGDPLGRVIRRGPEMPAIRVVGVVSDIRRGGRAAAIEPQVYLPAAQLQLYPLPLSEFAVRADGDPRPLAQAISAAVWSIDPKLPLTNTRTLAETLALRQAERNFQTFLFLLFAVLALALALVGLYGVVAYVVGQRTHEIGLRMALGASPGRILAWVMRQAAWLMFSGAAIGVAATFAVSQYVRSLLFQITPADPAAYAMAIAVLIAAASTAAFIAARRATRVDPLEALR
ncbi:MAG TPA: ABC transporter permease [Vicinamibacterales bacterium]|nr:ABC transporter permease [Vicinamibacterales bacterium]